jgi:spore protease
MGREGFFMFNFRTDLASERREIYQKANKLEEIDGIEANQEEIDENIKVERVKITNENGEKAIGKPIGNYITIDIKKLKIAQEEEIQKAAETLTKELKQVIRKSCGQSRRNISCRTWKYLCNTRCAWTKSN